ncbi:MAG: methyl-accepting chemotaxis protein, partial [Pseudomonadota bacterium]
RENASATGDTSSGVSAISRATSELDSAARSNTAVIDGAAEAAKQLQAEASRLKDAVLSFRLMNAAKGAADQMKRAS